MNSEVKGRRITDSCCSLPFCSDESTEAEPAPLGMSQPWMKLFPDASFASVSSRLVMISISIGGWDTQSERWINKHCSFSCIYHNIPISDIKLNKKKEHSIGSCGIKCLTRI